MPQPKHSTIAWAIISCAYIAFGHNNIELFRVLVHSYNTTDTQAFFGYSRKVVWQDQWWWLSFLQFKFFSHHKEENGNESLLLEKVLSLIHYCQVHVPMIPKWGLNDIHLLMRIIFVRGSCSSTWLRYVECLRVMYSTSNSEMVRCVSLKWIFCDLEFPRTKTAFFLWKCCRLYFLNTTVPAFCL